ncbi:MAG: PaaI family thioesterase [Firmicutes bacterium]|nr:PaaI family thioesterase [Bacillota bacterium]
MRIAPQSQEEFVDRIHSSLEFASGPQQEGTINAGLGMQLVDCDLSRRELTIAMEIKPWMYNPAATTIHGGVSAALADHAMGTLIYCVNDCEFTPTVSLSLTYLQPVRLDCRLLIRCTLQADGGRLATATATAWSEGYEDDPCFVTTATYYLIRKKS